jgi:hypothetical protein
VRLLQSEEGGRDFWGRDDRWDQAVGEREGRAGLGRLEAVWAGWLPGHGPSGLLASFFYFFLLFSFSFCSDFCLEFLKEFFYLDLNKFKADLFWSLKSVFRTYKPEV